MTKILLIPSPTIVGNCINRYIPYGLCSLQAVSQANGVEVDILQFSDSATEKIIHNSNEFVDVLLDQVNLDDYDTVGLSTVCNGFHHSLNIVKAIKYLKPRMRIWLGGPHVSVVAEKAINIFKDIDAVFVGECEATFAEVIGHRMQNDLKLDNIAGIQTREAKYIPRQPIANLDDLPPIYLSKEYLAGLSHHCTFGSKKEAPLEVTRGCPGVCSFCSTRLYWGGTVRRKSDERVISEMQRIFEITRVGDFDLFGDNFGFPHMNLLKFCQKMIAQKLDFRWRCSLRLNDLESEDLDLLWDAGCRGFFTGLESGSQETQKRIRKNVRLNHAREIITKSIDKGFAVETSFIIGFPWESIRDIDDTFKLHCKMLELGAKRSDIHVLIPLLGTPMIKRHKVQLEVDSYVPHDWMDLVPLDLATQVLVNQYPEMFVQMGYFENNKVDRIDIIATNDASRCLKSLYADS
jgi:radical SAM superfamily enzyme YgiQ (UPF0313 family)